MGYVHFDFTEIERQMRAMRDDAFVQAMSSATNDLQRQGFEAQNRFFESMLSAQIEMLRMVAEGRSPKFVGRVIGAHVGNIMINAISASTDPRALGDAMYDAMGKAIRSLAGEVEGFHSTMIEVSGEAGGRA
ncbi:hypothetical protein FBT96_20070 [Rhodobacter capsulatus]|uniref:Uncharacterized protein n=1 Tax=Rhodobacter capsulatus TaxID=1061 RepID=A0A4U1JK04_RHOCA|nr:hypothetical protein [Rhodobacter capsulatus]TKD12922.1 hypothetical protein FBT96_20070 [Rhodobacter capsulatus]